MKNTLKEIGGWAFIDPSLVVKFGVILDAYKLPQLEQLWNDAEREALKRMPTLSVSDFFFQEQKPVGDLIYSFRYYTPASNRKKIV